MPNPRTSAPRRQTPSTAAAGATGSSGSGGWGARAGVLAASGIAVLVVLAGIVIIATRSGDDPRPAGTATAKAAHVHGLGIDPQDGALYAGTHYGLFRLAEGVAATRVADRVQDFMGFTVVGSSHYLASGHPGEGQGGPSSLGLIESTDGGRTWQSLSLAGRADFHALEARHGRVYGLNSLTGEFLVSQDRQTWDTRSTIPMVDFAVSPDDPDVLLATTEQGLARSDDGGRTFQPVPSAPLLQLVSWAEDGTIVGAAPDGTLHASTDDGRTWQRRGSLGAAPHALIATSGSEVFAAVDGAILASADGGRTFDVRHRE